MWVECKLESSFFIIIITLVHDMRFSFVVVKSCSVLRTLDVSQ